MDDPVTQWINDLANGDREAAERLWREYYLRLIGQARKSLRRAPLRFADEEDAALSAFNSLCRGIETGRFPRIDDRDCLWRLLVTITARKVAALRRYHLRQKRGSGTVRGESCFDGANTESEAAGIARVLGREPTPEYVAQTHDEFDRLMGLLQDDEHRRIAYYNLAGYTTEEISALVGLSLRTVKRRLVAIREVWQSEVE